MPMIRECIVTTMGEEGSVHIAPLGLIEDGESWVIAPFRPSTNKDWPTRPAARVPGAVLDGTLAHLELAVESVEEDEVRPRFHCRIVHEETHAPFKGFNRAQAAVIETAILASRLKMLPREKIEQELAYLQIAVEKTAGPHEHEAWRILVEKIEDFYKHAPA
jgi:hypothetical protein